jgi:hypothetical protein
MKSRHNILNSSKDSFKFGLSFFSTGCSLVDKLIFLAIEIKGPLRVSIATCLHVVTLLKLFSFFQFCSSSFMISATLDPSVLAFSIFFLIIFHSSCIPFSNEINFSLDSLVLIHCSPTLLTASQ